MPKDVARQYKVPLETVLEAVDYCVKNKELLDAERAREDANIREAGRDRLPYAPATASPKHEAISG